LTLLSSPAQLPAYPIPPARRRGDDRKASGPGHQVTTPSSETDSAMYESAASVSSISGDCTRSRSQRVGQKRHRAREDQPELTDSDQSVEMADTRRSEYKVTVATVVSAARHAQAHQQIRTGVVVSNPHKVAAPRRALALPLRHNRSLSALLQAAAHEQIRASSDGSQKRNTFQIHNHSRELRMLTSHDRRTATKSAKKVRTEQSHAKCSGSTMHTASSDSVWMDTSNGNTNGNADTFHIFPSGSANQTAARGFDMSYDPSVLQVGLPPPMYNIGYGDASGVRPMSSVLPSALPPLLPQMAASVNATMQPYMSPPRGIFFHSSSPPQSHYSQASTGSESSKGASTLTTPPHPSISIFHRTSVTGMSYRPQSSVSPPRFTIRGNQINMYPQSGSAVDNYESNSTIHSNAPNLPLLSSPVSVSANRTFDFISNNVNGASVNGTNLNRPFRFANFMSPPHTAVQHTPSPGSSSSSPPRITQLGSPNRFIHPQLPPLHSPTRTTGITGTNTTLNIHATEVVGSDGNFINTEIDKRPSPSATALPPLSPMQL
jgi:hypothetical protein